MIVTKIGVDPMLAVVIFALDVTVFRLARPPFPQVQTFLQVIRQKRGNIRLFCMPEVVSS